MNASETPKASARPSSRRLWLRHRGVQMAVSSTAANSDAQEGRAGGPDVVEYLLGQRRPELGGGDAAEHEHRRGNGLDRAAVAHRRHATYSAAGALRCAQR